MSLLEAPKSMYVMINFFYDSKNIVCNMVTNCIINKNKIINIPNQICICFYKIINDYIFLKN
jgi:hypothetical protein